MDFQGLSFGTFGGQSKRDLFPRGGSQGSNVSTLLIMQKQNRVDVQLGQMCSRKSQQRKWSIFVLRWCYSRQEGIYHPHPGLCRGRHRGRVRSQLRGFRPDLLLHQVMLSWQYEHHSKLPMWWLHFRQMPASLTCQAGILQHWYPQHWL